MSDCTGPRGREGKNCRRNITSANSRTPCGHSGCRSLQTWILSAALAVMRSQAEAWRTMSKVPILSTRSTTTQPNLIPILATSLTTRSDPDHWRGVSWGYKKGECDPSSSQASRRHQTVRHLLTLVHLAKLRAIMKSFALLTLVGCVASTSAFTINFVNRCGFSTSFLLPSRCTLQDVTFSSSSLANSYLARCRQGSQRPT